MTFFLNSRSQHNINNYSRIDVKLCMEVHLQECYSEMSLTRSRYDSWRILNTPNQTPHYNVHFFGLRYDQFKVVSLCTTIFNVCLFFYDAHIFPGGNALFSTQQCLAVTHHFRERPIRYMMFEIRITEMPVLSKKNNVSSLSLLMLSADRICTTDEDILGTNGFVNCVCASRFTRKWVLSMSSFLQ